MEGDMAELQFLGFLGIFFEACKVITSRGKLFSKIALSLILPVSVLFLAHVQISDLIFAKIARNVDEMNFTPKGSAVEKRIALRVLSEYATLLLFKVVYLVAVVIFSFFSTSAVVYTVTCAYTAKDASFREVITVLLKVWKRLIVTFLCSFAILFLYSLAFVIFTVLILPFVDDNSVAIIVVMIIALFYLIGLLCFRIVWYLANVVSILEDEYGFSALQRSMNLLRGKKGTVCGILVVLQSPFLGIGMVFNTRQRQYMELGEKLGFALVILVIMTLLGLVQLVVQTVVYFVCKSYHREIIDKSILSDHLDVYSGEYLPLNQKDVQFGECGV